MPLTLDDFDYELPGELIAQHPAAERTASRLLRLEPLTSDGASAGITGQRQSAPADTCAGSLREAAARIEDAIITDLPRWVGANDVLVFNDTQVVRARLHGRRDSGGAVEVLIERVIDARQAWAQVRASHAPQPGRRLRLADAFEVSVESRSEDLFLLTLETAEPGWVDLLERHGEVPLPPYITHSPQGDDAERYQTVYAKHPGAVAAPTAGLHFDQALLERLRSAGAQLAWVTLHVGAGTFQPVRVRNLAEHRMHAERYTIPAETINAIRTAQARGGRVWAIGTTTLRALEAAAVEHAGFAAGAPGPFSGDTRLFITPGYQFQVIDRLLTNFHMPRSTLLMLVSAFSGSQAIRAAYAHAVAQRYRFFSYGDAMLIDRVASDADSGPVRAELAAAPREPR